MKEYKLSDFIMLLLAGGSVGIILREVTPLRIIIVLFLTAFFFLSRWVGYAKYKQ